MKRIFLLLGSLFTVACAENIVPPPGPGEEIEVVLTVGTPRSAPGAPRTRVQTEAETHISTAEILVLQYVDGDYVFRYQVSATREDASAGQTRFRALLPAREYGNLKLMLVGNASGAVPSSSSLSGMSEAALRKTINAPFTAGGLTGDLPLYGEVVLPSGLSADTYELSVMGLRSVARVDVEVEPGSGTDDFTLESVHVFRANDKIQVIPDNLLDPSGTPSVDAPSIPSGTSGLSSPLVKNGGGAAAVRGIYIPESSAAATTAERIDRATVVVVGGRYKGGDITYYRADFNSGTADENIGRVLRNHRYIFTVKEVLCEGWETPLLAATNLSSSMQVEVKQWQDFSTGMYWNDGTFAISSREVALPFVKGRTGRLDVETPLDYSIQWLDGEGTPVGEAASTPGTVISSGRFDAKIISGTGGLSHISFRTRLDNYTGDVAAEKLLITAGGWIVTVSVRQENSALYSKRSFNVFSGNADIGNLGVANNPSSASGEGMRWLLDLYFNPEAMIRIAGFTYTRLESSSNSYSLAVTSSSDSAYKNMLRIVERPDVIFLPYLAAPSTEIASAIMRWLEGDTRRVLIICCDTAATTPNLRALLTDDGTWQFNNIAATAPGYVRAADSSLSEIFFNGPFGEVPADGAMSRQDGYLGYTTGWADGGLVTPLISGSANTDAMVAGVNISRRIVYLGDSQIFSYGMGYGSYAITWNNQNTLMANLWAWITTQLIYGDDLWGGDWAQ